jgi:hypothetical protein
MVLCGRRIRVSVPQSLGPQPGMATPPPVGKAESVAAAAAAAAAAAERMAPPMSPRMPPVLSPQMVNLPSPSLSVPTVAALLDRTVALVPEDDPGAYGARCAGVCNTALAIDAFIMCATCMEPIAVVLSDFHPQLRAQDLRNIASIYGEVDSCEVRHAWATHALCTCDLLRHTAHACHAVRAFCCSVPACHAMRVVRAVSPPS